MVGAVAPVTVRVVEARLYPPWASRARTRIVRIPPVTPTAEKIGLRSGVS
jgi:hypothetical protein